MVIIAIFLWSIAVLLTLLIIAISIPVHVFVSSAGDTSAARVRIEWLFGVVRVVVFDSSQPKRRDKKKTRSSKKRSNRKKKRHFTLPEDPVDVVAGLVRLLRSLIRMIRFQGTGTVTIGLDDPADTGVLFGCLLSVIWQAERLSGIAVIPAYTGQTIAFDGQISVRVVPIVLILPTLAFIISCEGRRLVRAFRGYGSRNKERA